jgi:hypothetical protein
MAPIPAHEECWGGLLQCIGAEECGRLRDRSCRHFKSKFCADCRWAMAVPVTRVRVLTDQVAHMLENRRSVGMWTTAPDRMGSFRFRIINNTKGCAPPALVVFEKPPPKCVPWTKLDAELVDDNGMVQLCVSKGTAVPIHHVKGRNRVEFMARDPGSRASSTTSSPVPSRASSPGPPDLPDSPDPPDAFDAPDPPDAPYLPTLCEVVMPSALMQLANSAVPSMDSPPSSPTPSSLSRASPTPTTAVPPLSKQERRMQRNRESAATSRERKRKYVSYLEQQVCQLERSVELLRQENWFWRSLEVDKYDPTCPLWVCEWF